MQLIRVLLVILGAYLLIRGFIESRLPDGQVIEMQVYILLYAVGAVFLLGGILLPVICTAFLKSILFCILILLLGSILSFLFVTVSLIAAALLYIPRAEGSEKVLLVLGAPVINNQPSFILQSRANLAAEWAEQHPDQVIIISGGKGGIKSEAETIADLMAEKGVNRNRLYLENQSTTTEENFRCVKTLMGEQFDFSTEPVVVLTNAFHVFRLRYFTQRQGYGNVRFVMADTPPSVRLLWYTREVVLTIRYWFTGKS